MNGVKLLDSIVEDKISYLSLLAACEHESTLADMIANPNIVLSSDGKNYSKLVYCNKYIYQYNSDDVIWEEVEASFLIADIESWIRGQYIIVDRELGTDIEKKAKLAGAIKKVIKYKHLENVFKFLKRRISDPKFFDKLDRVRPNHLPIKDNKIVDLETGKVSQRSIADYFSFFCPVCPVKKTSQYFKDVMSSIMCGNEENLAYLQKMMGYCMTGSKEAQAYFIWYGKGSNGKSLILNLLKAVLGKACDPVSKSVLVDTGKKSNNGTEIVSLKDLRLGTFSETNTSEALNEGILKMISGADRIKARGLFKDEISFELFLKLIICTNNKPDFNGADYGTTRRIKFLPFDAKFVSTKPNSNKCEYAIIENLEQILITEYLDDFFTFCLEGCKMWYQDKKFNIVPKDIKSQEMQYIAEQNSFQGWFGSSIVVHDKERLDRSEAFKSYSKYCDDMGIKAVTKKELFGKLKEECGETKLYKGVHKYTGFMLTIEEGDDSDDDVHELDM